MNEWSKIATLEAVSESHTRNIDKLSDICTTLARTVGDINTTQLLMKQLVEQIQAEAHDLKKETQQISLRVAVVESWKQKFSGGWFVVGVGATATCSIIGLILLAIQTYRTH